MSHIIFDLDQTLVDTSRLDAYRATRAGRNHIEINVGQMDTRLYNSDAVRYVQRLHRRGNVSVLTNSPVNFAFAVLQKHGFPRDLPIYGSASKPDVTALRKLMREQGVQSEDCLMVGDKALDILTAHEIRMASVGVEWGGYNTKEQLELARPLCTASSFDELLEAIEIFDQGDFDYHERDLTGYRRLENVSGIEPIIQVVSLGDYTPYGRDQFSGHSSKILRFKQAKDYTVEEINDDAANVFYNGYSLKQDPTFKEVMLSFVPPLRKALSRLDPAETLVIAAPNSLPEFCYRSDIPRAMVRTAFRGEKRLLTGRGIKRVRPKLEAHLHGRTSEQEHLHTMGWDRNLLNPAVENVVVFDDIWTSGTQIRTMVKMLRELEIGKNYYALVLGETT